MNTTLNDLFRKLTSGEIPTGILAAAGVILLLLTLKMNRGFMRMTGVWLGIALLAGAVWWHFHNH
jgi:hypothetical protein